MLFIIICTCVCFGVVCYLIYKFSEEVTNPITKLTKFTDDYKQAKSLEKKEQSVHKISRDEIFERTKSIVEKEARDKGTFMAPPVQRYSINNKSGSFFQR